MAWGREKAQLLSQIFSFVFSDVFPGMEHAVLIVFQHNENIRGHERNHLVTNNQDRKEIPEKYRNRTTGKRRLPSHGEDGFSVIDNEHLPGCTRQSRIFL